MQLPWDPEKACFYCYVSQFALNCLQIVHSSLDSVPTTYCFQFVIFLLHTTCWVCSRFCRSACVLYVMHWRHSFVTLTYGGMVATLVELSYYCRDLQFASWHEAYVQRFLCGLMLLAGLLSLCVQRGIHVLCFIRRYWQHQPARITVSLSPWLLQVTNLFIFVSHFSTTHLQCVVSCSSMLSLLCCCLRKTLYS